MAATKTKHSGWKLLRRLMRYQPKLRRIDSFLDFDHGPASGTKLIIRNFFNTSRANLNSASLPGPSLPCCSQRLGANCCHICGSPYQSQLRFTISYAPQSLGAQSIVLERSL